MSTSAHAFIVYGILLPETETARLRDMDWTPVEEVEEVHGVRVLQHGSVEAPHRFVIGMIFADAWSWRDTPVMLTGSLVPKSSWDDELTKALYKLDISPHLQRGWYLVANWG